MGLWSNIYSFCYQTFCNKALTGCVTLANSLKEWCKKFSQIGSVKLRRVWFRGFLFLSGNVFKFQFKAPSVFVFLLTTGKQQHRNIRMKENRGTGSVIKARTLKIYKRGTKKQLFPLSHRYIWQTVVSRLLVRILFYTLSAKQQSPSLGHKELKWN